MYVNRNNVLVIVVMSFLVWRSQVNLFQGNKHLEDNQILNKTQTDKFDNFPIFLWVQYTFINVTRPKKSKLQLYIFSLSKVFSKDQIMYKNQPLEEFCLHRWNSESFTLILIMNQHKVNTTACRSETSTQI